MKDSIKLTHAFSLNMVKEEDLPFIKMREIPLSDVLADLSWCKLDSYVGTNEMSAILSGILEQEVPLTRRPILLEGPEDRIIVAKTFGARIPKGATSLPKNIKLKFVEVCLVRPTVLSYTSYDAQEMTQWPVEDIAEVGPTVIHIIWPQNELTSIRIAKTLDGSYAAYVESRGGQYCDFVVDCGSQTWGSIMEAEEQA